MRLALAEVGYTIGRSELASKYLVHECQRLWLSAQHSQPVLSPQAGAQPTVR